MAASASSWTIDGVNRWAPGSVSGVNFQDQFSEEAARRSAMKSAMKSMIFILCALLAIPAIAVERIVSVKGAAEIEVTPDIVTIGYAVIKLAPDAAAAKSYVDKVSSDTIRAAIAQGVKEDDISSSNLDI